MTDSPIRHSHTLEEIIRTIQNEDEFLITTHVNPDGDSLACVLVFASMLQQLQKRHAIVLDDPVPSKYQFLPDSEKIHSIESLGKDKSWDHVIVLDASNPERIGQVQDFIREGVEVINIDHHPGNTAFGNYYYIDPDQSSTVELVFRLYELCELTVTPKIAETVYTGIMCDTGCFRYSNTNAQSLELSAQMVRFGVVPSEVFGLVHNRHSDHTLRSLGRAFSRIEFDLDKHVVGMFLTQKDLQEYPETDTEGFVNYLLMIKDTQIQYFAKEVAPNCYRVSFRSRCDVDVNAIAGHFSGGGHAKAAGCFIEGNMEQVRDQIVKSLAPFFEPAHD